MFPDLSPKFKIFDASAFYKSHSNGSNTENQEFFTVIENSWDFPA
jgi:hypothetical protein